MGLELGLELVFASGSPASAWMVGSTDLSRLGFRLESGLGGGVVVS